MTASTEQERLRCSAKGCTRDASFALRWNNPKLHTLERRKTWLACGDHRDSLTDFLSLRGMFRECEPVDTDFVETTREEIPSP